MTSPLAHSLLVAGALAPLRADAAEVDVKGVEYTSAGATIEKVSVGGKSAVKIEGKGTPVTLDLAAALAKKGDGAGLKSFGFGIQHVDAGTHTFEIAFGRSGSLVPSPYGKVSMQCNESPPVGKAYFLCDEGPCGTVLLQCNGAPAAPSGKAFFQCNEGPASPYGKVLMLCNEAPKAGMGHAVIAPEFAGSSTYAIRVVKNGEVVGDLKGCKGAIAIPNFEAVGGESHSETLRVNLRYGAINDGAWTIEMIHEEWTISITAEAKQASDVAELSLLTTGLDTVTLTGQKLKTGKAK